MSIVSEHLICVGFHKMTLLSIENYIDFVSELLGAHGLSRRYLYALYNGPYRSNHLA